MRNTKIAIIMGTCSFKVVQISASCTIQHLPSTVFLEDRQLMFTYRKFWEKCEEQGISKTKLIRHYKVGHDTIERLKTDRSVSMCKLSSDFATNSTVNYRTSLNAILTKKESPIVAQQANLYTSVKGIFNSADLRGANCPKGGNNVIKTYPPVCCSRSSFKI